MTPSSPPTNAEETTRSGSPLRTQTASRLTSISTPRIIVGLRAAPGASIRSQDDELPIVRPLDVVEREPA